MLKNAEDDGTQSESLLEPRRKEVKLSQTGLIIVSGWSYK